MASSMETFKNRRLRYARIAVLKKNIQLAWKRTMDTQDTLGRVASSLETTKPPKDYPKGRANRRKGRPANQQTLPQSTSHGAPEENIFAEGLSLGSYTSESGCIKDFDRNACRNSPQVPRYQPGREVLPINQPFHTSLPLRNSRPAVNNRSGQVPSVQRSNLSVLAYHGHPLPGIDKQYRHSKAQPFVQPEPSKIRRWSGPPPATFRKSTAPSLVKGPHRKKDPNTHGSSPRQFFVKTPTHLPPPIPTPTYVTQAHATPLLLPSPQSLLLVLDLNRTLLHRTTHESGKIKDFIRRPSLNSFLNYAFAHHSVLIWSSAEPSNVRVMCSRFMKRAQRKALLGQWGRDTLGLTKAQYRKRVQVFKRLDRIWNDEKLQRKHPNSDKGERWGQHNTVLIDNSLLKASTQPYNHIEVPGFTEGSETAKGGMDVFRQVVGYLEEVRWWADVSAFMREKRFRVDEGWRWVWRDKARDNWRK